MTSGSDYESPDWLTWFTPARLAAFNGNAQLKGGQQAQAHKTLTAALVALSPDEGEQRTVLLGDWAAVEAARKDAEAACAHAEPAMDQLAITWVRHRHGSHP